MVGLGPPLAASASVQSASGAEMDRSQRAVTLCPWEDEGGRPRDAPGPLLVLGVHNLSGYQNSPELEEAQSPSLPALITSSAGTAPTSGSVSVLGHFSRVRLCDPTDCSPPGSSVHAILQARILEWVAMPSSRGHLSDPGVYNSGHNCRLTAALF